LQNTGYSKASVSQEIELETKKFSRTRDFANEVQRLLDRIAGNNQSFGEACVAFFGVTSAQGGTLLALPVKETLRMNELSKTVGVDSSTMTRMIDQLVEKDLVFRQTDVKDRRLVRIGLTASGQKLHRDLAGALAGFYRDSLDEIQEEEREMIIRSLERLNNAIARGLENCCRRYCGQEK
jgi:DNA-binding MarR family transcriptional regulator